MKKIFSKIIISFVLFGFIIPVSFKVNKISAAGEWYYTKTNNKLIGLGAGAVEFIKATSLEECNKKISTLQSTPDYTIGQCTEKKEAPSGEGWGYNVDTKVAPLLANNPIGFKTEESCNINRDAYLSSDIHKNDTFFVSISPCSYKKNINNDGVVYVDGKIGATENKSRYNLLAPIGKIKCMDWSESSNKVVDGEPECIDNNIGTYLNFIFKFGIGLCAAMAVVMLIIYGVVYMGDESVFGKTEAKSKMFGAVVGLLIALGGWVLLNSINRDLTGATGFKIDQTNVIIESFDVSGAATFDGKPIKINFNTQAYPNAKFASEKTGVETAFILAMFDQETSNGSNTGKCNYLTANMGNGQLEALKRVAVKLKISDISTINMSCGGVVKKDHGGAIGLTQFIPTTWEMYANEAEKILGHYPNPWDTTAKDPLMMTALFLKGNGGAGSNINNQEKAACSYFGSCTQTVSCGGGITGTYGKCILGKKVSIQQQIDAAIKKGDIK